jgi:hypothetical protein
LEVGRRHRMPNQGSTVGGGWQPFLVSPEAAGWGRKCRWGVVMVKQPGLFLPNFRATSLRVFTWSPQNVTVEPRIHSLAPWDKFF